MLLILFSFITFEFVAKVQKKPKYPVLHLSFSQQEQKDGQNSGDKDTNNNPHNTQIISKYSLFKFYSKYCTFI